MTRIKGLKQCLAGALALGAVAAVPTVVASSQAQQGLAPWQPSGAGGGSAACDADAESAAVAPGGSAAAPPDWSLSRVLEGVLQQVRQLAVGGLAPDKEAGSEEEAEEGWEDELPAAALAADHAASLDLQPAAAAAPPHAQQLQAQPPSGRQRRRGRDFLSARRVAAENPEEVRQLRLMVVAELARLRAEDSGGSRSSGAAGAAAAAPAKQRQQAARRGQQQQAPPPPPSQQLEQAGQGQLPARFTNAELVRFAIMQGLLQAASPAEREAKLREGAAAAARTALWLERHPFSSEDELNRFAHLVRWEGPDAAGRPVLRILIGEAVTECRGNAALTFANAIITHMEQGVSSRLHDAPPQPEPASSSGSRPSPPLQFVISQPAEVQGLGQRGSPSGGSSDIGTCGSSASSSGSDPGTAQPLAPGSGSPAAAAAAVESDPIRPVLSTSPEQIVVLMDCRGASTLNAARISWVFKAVASSLSHHYPGRLHELVLLDLPVVLVWMVKGVKQLVHPDTRSKFRVVHAGQGTAQQAQQAAGSGSAPAAGGEQLPQETLSLQGAAATAASAQQAGKAPAQQQQQQGVQHGQQEGLVSQPEVAAPKRPPRQRTQRAGNKRKTPTQEHQEQQAAQEGTDPTEQGTQPPADEQPPAAEPAVKQPAQRRRRRGRLAEQQAAAEPGQAPDAAAAAAAAQSAQ